MATLTVIKGGDYNIPVQVNDSAGSGIDITGQTLFFTVKHTAANADDDALISKDITSHTTPASGLSALILTDDDTDIAAGQYVFDFKRKDSTTNTPYGEGEFIVKSSITIRES